MTVYNYAEAIAMIENCIAVVSDLKLGKSKIYAGEFATILGLDGYTDENSMYRPAHCKPPPSGNHIQALCKQFHRGLPARTQTRVDCLEVITKMPYHSHQVFCTY